MSQENQPVLALASRIKFLNATSVFAKMDNSNRAVEAQFAPSATLSAAFERQPPKSGVADLFAFTSESALLRSVQAAVILAMLTDSDRPRFRKVQLMVRNSRVTNRLALLSEALDFQLSLACGHDASSARTRERIELKPCDGSPRPFLNALGDDAAGTAIVLPDIDLMLRSHAPLADGHVVVRKPGWPDDASDFVGEIVSVVARTGAYALMTTTSDLHKSEGLHPGLAKLDGLGVYTFEDQNALFELETDIQSLRVSLKQRRWAEALGRVDGLGRSMPLVRALLRVSVLAHGGLIGQAQSEFDRIVPVLDLLAPSLSLFAAKVAIDIGVERRANESIRELLLREHNELQLEQALQLALDMGDLALANQVAVPLAASLPNSETLRQFRIASCIEGSDLQTAITVAAGDSSVAGAELLEALRSVASAQGESWSIDADVVVSNLRELSDGGREYGLEVAARLLELQGRFSDAATVIVAGDDHLPASRAGRLLRLVRRSIRSAANDIADDQMIRILAACSSTLSERSADWQLRQAMSNLFDPTILGGRLHPIAAALMLWCVGRRERLPTVKRRSVDGRCPPDKLSEYLRTAFDWIKQNGGVVVSGEPIPVVLPGVAPASIVASLHPVIEQKAKHSASPEDLDHLRLLIALVTNLNCGMEDQVLDIEAIRVAAVRLAEAGHTQAARDFAEQALMAAGTSPIRSRHAWYSYADIYARIGYHAEALAALACTYSSRAEPSWEEEWQQATLAFRLLRDIGVAEVGLPFLDMQLQAVKMLELAPEYELRIETLRLQAQTRRVLENGRFIQERVESLLPRAVEHVERVFECDEERAPAAMLLASIIRLSDESGIAIAPRAREMLEDTYLRVSPALGQLLQAEATRYPFISQLESLAASAGASKFAYDLGYELNRVAMLARRTLNDQEIDAARAALAIELAADHSSKATDSMNIIGRAADLIRALEELSSEYLAIALVGMSSAGLVRLTLWRGAVEGPLREPEEVFSPNVLRDWSRTYPYAYGSAENSNVFYTSTQHLGISSLPPRCLVIADTEFQKLPPNLLNLGGDLAGRRIRLASCPSVSWLYATRSRGVETQSGRAAWIPFAPDKDGLAPLSVLAARLNGCFEEHMIRLERSLSSLDSPEGLGLLIVGAHGAVTDTKSYFKTLADDDGNLIASDAVVQRAGNSKIVVLFVCSGGRLDAHPEANSLIGLPGNLLGAGVQAVLAPAWPLEVSVPPVWLPEFLSCVERGEAVIDACFSADLSVSSRLVEDPRLSLAMSVYGDPETRL